jgi:pilus assembly protein Flp/PilA
MEFMMITKLYVRAQLALIDFKNDQRGVTAIEYAVLAAAVAAAVTAAFAGSSSTGLEGALTGAMKKVCETIASGATGTTC